MANATSVPPLLAMRRSPQSGAKAMTAAWQTVYTDLSLSTLAYLFCGANINLSTMQAADHIEIRVQKQMVPGGAMVLHDLIPYDNAQPANHPSCMISAIPDVYGVQIDMRQTAGTLRSIECEFYAAKILGTS